MYYIVLYLLYCIVLYITHCFIILLLFISIKTFQNSIEEVRHCQYQHKERINTQIRMFFESQNIVYIYINYNFIVFTKFTDSI